MTGTTGATGVPRLALATPVQRIAVAVCAGLLTLVSCLFVVVDSTYDSRLGRDAARTPAEVGLESPGASTAVAHFSWRSDPLGDLDVQVLYFAALDESAAPPPGVPRWPAPGEVWASAALRQTPGSDTFLARYGTLAGTIDASTLTDEGERIAYVGADDRAVVPPPWWTAVTHFGVPVSEDGTGYLGAAAGQGTKRSLLVGLTVFGAAPALVALTALTALGAEPRRRTLAQLRVIGAGPKVIRRTLGRPFRTPIAIGSTVAFLAVLVSMVLAWPVPGAHLRVSGSDYRSPTDILGAAAITVGAAAATWACVQWQHRASTLPRIGQGSRPRPVGRRGFWLLVLAADLAVTNWGFAVLYPTDPGLAQLVALAGCALTLVVLVPCIGILTSLFGRVLARLAWRFGSAPALIGAREVADVPRAATRAVSVVAMAIVLAAQLQILMSQPGPEYQAALQAQSVNQDRSVIVDLGTTARAHALDLRRSERAGLSYVGLDGRSPVNEVIGDCPALTHVFGSCPAVPTPASTMRATSIPQVMLWNLAPDAVVRRAGTGEMASSVLLAAVAPEGHRVTPDGLTAELGEQLTPPPNVRSPQIGWLVGARTGLDHARWYTVGGYLALVIALVMGGLIALAELERLTARHRIVRYYAHRTRQFLALGVTLVAVPAAAAALLGAGAALALSVAPTSVPGADGVTPVSGILGMLAASLLYVLVLGAAAGLWIRRGSRHDR